jgi:SanA protein
VLTILLVTPRAISLITAIPQFRSVDSVEHHTVAIILAAEVLPNNTPSAVLRDRISTGVELYNTGKADLLVMSGDAPEPEIMRAYAIQQGVPAEDILLDNYGLRTYDTCYRAANIYQLEKTIVVTQLFHLPRTLLLCRQMGIEVVGVPAHPTIFWPHQTMWWQTRETLATILAFSDLFVSPPEVSNLPYGESN